MAPLTLPEIPSLSLLYKLGRLSAPKTSTPLSPNASFNAKISTLQHDITRLGTDCIVNAANNSLMGGGGVDGAIHRAAGPGLARECEPLDGCDTGGAKITNAYKLPCKKVIHAVGPVYSSTKRKGMHETLLRGCYRRSLELAVENRMRSIAFSAISTGVYGYPSREAAETAVSEVRTFLEQGKGEELERIVFCNFMDNDVDAYEEVLPYFFPPTEHDIRKNEDAQGKSEVKTEKGNKGKDKKETPAAEEKNTSAQLSQLPDAPTDEPISPEPGNPTKKQKTKHNALAEEAAEPAKEGSESSKV